MSCFEFAQLLRINTGLAVFVHDEHSEPVAGVEQLGCGCVVAGADGVGTHFFELLHAEDIDRIRHRHADTRRVLMITRSFQLNAPAIQEKSLVGVPTQGANAKRCFVAIQHGAAAGDGGHEPVQVRGFDDQRFGLATVRRRKIRSLRPAGAKAIRFAAGDGLTVGVQNCLLNCKVTHLWVDRC